VGWRQCEVVVTLPGGRRYSAIVEAKSTFHAALVFQAHCLNAPEGLQRPHIEPGTVLEVRPIYRVKVQEARCSGRIGKTAATDAKADSKDKR
jgi:hypothetical protein